MAAVGFILAFFLVQWLFDAFGAAIATLMLAGGFFLWAIYETVTGKVMLAGFGETWVRRSKTPGRFWSYAASELILGSLVLAYAIWNFLRWVA